MSWNDSRSWARALLASTLQRWAFVWQAVVRRVWVLLVLERRALERMRSSTMGFVSVAATFWPLVLAQAQSFLPQQQLRLWQAFQHW